jgi:hypothetical protein
MSQTDQILALLIAERDRLSRAIEILGATAKRRGRPPKSPLAAVAGAPALAQKRKARTAAQRKAQSQRMKKYWANRKKSANS